jgi:hypothetical protein
MEHCSQERPLRDDLRPCVWVPANAHCRGRRSRGALWRRAGACANARRQSRRAHAAHSRRAGLGAQRRPRASAATCRRRSNGRSTKPPLRQRPLVAGPTLIADDGSLPAQEALRAAAAVLAGPGRRGRPGSTAQRAPRRDARMREAAGCAPHRRAGYAAGRSHGPSAALHVVRRTSVRGCRGLLARRSPAAR